MKVKVTLPQGYGRSHLGSDSFVRSEPTFNVEAFGDDGGRVQDPYPSSVKMGPEMYEFLSRIMPAIAARRGEDLSYNGVVQSRPRSNKERFAYYGFGINPLTNRQNEGVGLIGYGDVEHPPVSRFGTQPASGKPNHLYTMRLDAPSPHGSNSRSSVLTNILNDSWDFSPLLAPLYDFQDPDYDPDNDPDKKGPKLTDHWVPRNNPDGTAMFTPEGKRVWMPIPLVQDLPIYNMKHPMWGEDPERAWNLVNDIPSAYDWRGWGKAPSFANFRGETSRTDSGAIRPRDYLLENTKMADRPGYFVGVPHIKGDRHENLRDIKHERKADKIKAAHGRESDRIAQEKGLEDMSGAKRRQYYRALVGKMFFDQYKPILEARGVTPEEKNDVIRFAKDSGFDKYNKLPDDESKMIVILDDYVKDKAMRDSVKNIAGAVQDGPNG